MCWHKRRLITQLFRSPGDGKVVSFCAMDASRWQSVWKKEQALRADAWCCVAELLRTRAR